MRIVGKHRHVRLESLRFDRNRPDASLSQTKCYPLGKTYETERKAFQPLMGKTMEVYIDDMLVKSKERPDHTKHLQETFELLRTYAMKLNPLKCAFEVSSGKFLGFMVTQKGIEASLIQLRAIMESQTPTFRKGV